MIALTYKEIVERLATIKEDMERLHTRQERDGRLESEDEERWNKLAEEFEDLLQRKYNLEKQADLLRVSNADIKPKVGSNGNPIPGTRGLRTEGGSDEMDSDPLGQIDSISETRGIRDPWDTSEIRLGMSPESHSRELRVRAETAIERMQGTTPQRRETMQQILQRWDTKDSRLSQQLLATSSPDYLRAFAKLAANNGRGEGLSDRERGAVARAMSLTDAAGGYLVPFQLDPTVILTSDGSVNEIRQISRTVVATGDVWNGVSAGAVNWSFYAEAAQVTDDAPTFAQPTVTVRTARGFVPISLEAFMDEANVATEVGRLLAEGKDELEAQVFTDGTAGANEPVGIVTALVAAGGSVIVPSATTDIFALEDVYETYGQLPARHRRRANWLANNLTYTATRQFDTAGGSALWAQLGEATPQTLLGRGAFESETMDGTVNAAQNNYLAIFGDFQHYVIADRIGMTVEFIPHLFHIDNNRPSGQRGWFAFYRVGANVTHAGAFRLLNVT